MDPEEYKTMWEKIQSMKQTWKTDFPTHEKKIKETKTVVQRSFVSGVATFEVTTSLSSQKYAEAVVLIGAKQFKLKVVGITANKLDAKFVETK